MTDKLQPALYCHDCGKILNGISYAYHNADHTVSRIEYRLFPLRVKPKTN